MSWVHPTAIIEDGVTLGEGTRVYDHAHLRRNCRIGRDCIIGGKTTIAYEVVIGDFCKINSAAYIPFGVTLEDGVMISAGVIFTNDRFPRAANADLTALAASDPDEHTGRTRVGCGATIGAGAVIGSDLTIGRWAVVGMGSVVTRDVGDYQLAYGSPARPAGVVCRCGMLLHRFAASDSFERLVCARCERTYSCEQRVVQEL